MLESSRPVTFTSKNGRLVGQSHEHGTSESAILERLQRLLTKKVVNELMRACGASLSDKSD